MVDITALSAFILKEPGWKKLAPYLVDAVSVGHIIKEVTNAIWKACTVKKVISETDAVKLYKILDNMINVNIVIDPEEKYVEKALRIALRHRITIYDALYLALAREKNLLLTLDEKQSSVAGELG